MKDSIHDIDDYADFMTRQLRSIRHFERCVFAVWCAHHLLDSHRDLLAENLSKPDLHTLRRIVEELWETLLDGVIPGKDQLNALDMDVMAIDMAIDADDPVAIDVQNVVGLCILCCRRNNVVVAEQAGEDVIRILAVEMDEQGINIDEVALFSHPVMKKELDAQLAMIRHLRGDYPLRASLRSMFRR